MNWAAIRAQAVGHLSKSQRWAIERARAKRNVSKAGFDPDEPRDPGSGEWTSGGGKPKPSGGKHPGEGYSKHAWEDKDGVIHTTKVEDAQRALMENRKVDLDQPKKISTLIHQLGKLAHEAIEASAKGQKPPNINLCNVTVQGENLFCQNNKDIPRVKMPQLDEESTKALLKHLKDKGYDITKEREYAHHLRATQNEISGLKVAIQAEKAKKKPERLMKRLVVSKDDYILDGHHHYGAKLGLDAKDNNLTNDTQMKIWRVNIGIMDLLKEAKAFSGPPKPVTELSLDPDACCRGDDPELAQWIEYFKTGNPYHKPPGPGGGQFTSGPSGGGGGTPAAPASEPQGELFPDLPKIKKKPTLQDFAKDNVAVIMGNQTKRTLGDDGANEEFLEQWNEHIGESPAEFKQHFMGGLPGDMNVTFLYEKPSERGYGGQNELEIKGTIESASGNDIATFTRTIDLKANTAHSDYFNVNPSSQHRDIGKQFLAGNIETYKKLGIHEVGVQANIDVGGYAWAKYGYVPTDLWALANTLRDTLGGSEREPDSWDEMSSEQQDQIFDAWADASYDEFLDSEVDSWRDSGGDLEEAKIKLAQWFSPYAQNENNAWAVGVIDAMKPKGVDIDRILSNISVEFNSHRGDGEGDPDITVDETQGLMDDQRAAMTDALVDAFNKRADRLRSEIDAPDYLSDNVRDYQRESFDQMRDRDKFDWALRNDKLPGSVSDDAKIDISESDRDHMLSLVDDLERDGKALWAIADSKYGKQLLLGADWEGSLDLDDPEAMARFNAYVSKAKKKPAVA